MRGSRRKVRSATFGARVARECVRTGNHVLVIRCNLTRAMRLNEVANRMEMLLRFGLGHVNAGATVPAKLEELLIVGDLEAIRLQELIVLPNWKRSL